jgi:hypothetical protein
MANPGKINMASNGVGGCRTLGSDPVSCIASAEPLDQILLIALCLTVRHFGIDDASHLGSEIGCMIGDYTNAGRYPFGVLMTWASSRYR